MALSSASFERNQVTLYLSTRFPYAATCFARETEKHGERISSLVVEKWFKSYFPSNVNQHQFRLLESVVSQWLNLNAK